MKFKTFLNEKDAFDYLNESKEKTYITGDKAKKLFDIFDAAAKYEGKSLAPRPVDNKILHRREVGSDNFYYVYEKEFLLCGSLFYLKKQV